MNLQKMNLDQLEKLRTDWIQDHFNLVKDLIDVCCREENRVESPAGWGGTKIYQVDVSKTTSVKIYVTTESWDARRNTWNMRTSVQVYYETTQVVNVRLKSDDYSVDFEDYIVPGKYWLSQVESYVLCIKSRDTEDQIAMERSRRQHLLELLDKRVP